MKQLSNDNIKDDDDDDDDDGGKDRIQWIMICIQHEPSVDN